MIYNSHFLRQHLSIPLPFGLRRFFFKLLSHLKYFNIELVDLLMTNGRHHLLRWPRERVVFIQLRMGYVSVNLWGGGRAYLREIIPTLKWMCWAMYVRSSMFDHSKLKKGGLSSITKRWTRSSLFNVKKNDVRVCLMNRLINLGKAF